MRGTGASGHGNTEQTRSRARSSQAAAHIASAHEILKVLQEKIGKHPELGAAITKLEIFIRHAESRHLRTAKMFSMVIAHAKQQKEIQLQDLIAGIYVANFDRILRFWPDAATFEDFVAEHCGWSEHRLSTWDRWNYNVQHPPRTISIPFTSRFFRIPRKHTFAGKMFGLSDELKRVYGTAEGLSPNKVTSFRRVVPLITPELFLVATVRTEGVELAKRLRDSGIQLSALEEVAVRPLEEPDKLMF